MEGAIGDLEGDLMARDARRRQQVNVEVISKETRWEETNMDMGQNRTSGGRAGTQCGQFLDWLTNEWVFMKHSPTYCYFFSPGATTPIGGCILQPSSGL